MDTPDKLALGLESHTLICDRAYALYRVLDDREVTWWPEYATRKGIRDRTRQKLEDGGRRPEKWWVSEVAVPVERVRSYVSPFIILA